MTKSIARFGASLLTLALALALSTPASAQTADPARALLEQAAEAMGGLERLESLDNIVLTGFGQRVYYQGGGFLTGEERALPTWISVTDAQRTFYLPRADRRSGPVPLAPR